MVNGKPEKRQLPSTNKIPPRSKHHRVGQASNAADEKASQKKKKKHPIQSVVLNKEGIEALQESVKTTTSTDADAAAGTKGTDSSSGPTLLLIKRLHVFPPHKMPQYWDISHLDKNSRTQHIRCLLLALESHSKFSRLRPAYFTIRKYFVHYFGYIQLHSSNPQPTKHNQLYDETIAKLNSLLKLANRLESDDNKETKTTSAKSSDKSA